MNRPGHSPCTVRLPVFDKLYDCVQGLCDLNGHNGQYVYLRQDTPCLISGDTFETFEESAKLGPEHLPDYDAVYAAAWDYIPAIFAAQKLTDVQPMGLYAKLDPATMKPYEVRGVPYKIPLACAYRVDEHQRTEYIYIQSCCFYIFVDDPSREGYVLLDRVEDLNCTQTTRTTYLNGIETRREYSGGRRDVFDSEHLLYATVYDKYYTMYSPVHGYVERYTDRTADVGLIIAIGPSVYTPECGTITMPAGECRIMFRLNHSGDEFWQFIVDIAAGTWKIIQEDI